MTRGVDADCIDPIAVFDSYDWKCAYCRCDTPRDKRGSSDDDAPELDHVAPIAKGGQHTYANTQLLCRACNAAKSDLVIQRLSLVKEGVPRGAIENDSHRGGQCGAAASLNSKNFVESETHGGNSWEAKEEGRQPVSWRRLSRYRLASNASLGFRRRAR